MLPRWFLIWQNIFCSKAIMVDLKLYISLLKDQIDPHITVRLDREILIDGPQCDKAVTIGYRGLLHPGNHRLEIVYHNMHKISKKHPDMAVIVEKVTLQSVDHDFKIYSRYEPDYPCVWLQEQIAQGQSPLAQIHSNYMGWNGKWFFNFKTPIYQWIHQRMDLGWQI